MSRRRKRKRGTKRPQSGVSDRAGELRLGRERYFVEESMAPDGSVLKARSSRGKRCVIRFRQRRPFNELDTMERAQECDRFLPEVIQHGKSAQGHYLVTTWAGGDRVLQDLLPEIGSKTFLPAERSYQWMRSLAECLLKLHHTCARIVHGDLKPANLALTEDERRLVLIDFGFSWSIAKTSRRPNGQLGSRFYASPEQWNQDQQVGPFSDQFSASVVFYRTLTNQLPYEGLGGEALSQGRSYGKPLEYDPPSRFNREVWPALDDVIGRGLALDIEDRYGTTRQWLSAIRAAARAPSFNLVDKVRRWFGQARRSVVRPRRGKSENSHT